MPRGQSLDIPDWPVADHLVLKRRGDNLVQRRAGLNI